MNYVQQTKRFLQKYPWLKYYVDHLHERIADIYDTSVPMVAQYGERIGYSTLEKTHPGAKLADNEGFQLAKMDLEDAKRDVKRIEDLIGMLPSVEQVIIRLRYFEKSPASWEAIALAVKFDRANCFRMHDKAIRNMSIALFGPRAAS